MRGVLIVAVDDEHDVGHVHVMAGGLDDHDGVLGRHGANVLVSGHRTWRPDGNQNGVKRGPARRLTDAGWCESR